MPLYEFRCQDCGAVYQERRRFTEANEESTCPTCQSQQTIKLISTAVFISAGNGGFQSAPSQAPRTTSSSGCGCGSCGCGS